MAFTLDIEPQSGIAIGTFLDRCDAEASRDALTALWEMPGWRGEAVVWDARSARIDVSAEDVQGVAQFILSHQPKPPPARVAFVTEDDLSFGLIRMLEVYREDPSTETRVMRSFDQAVTWARKARTADGSLKS